MSNNRSIFNGLSKKIEAYLMDFLFSFYVLCALVLASYKQVQLDWTIARKESKHQKGDFRKCCLTFSFKFASKVHCASQSTNIV